MMGEFEIEIELKSERGNFDKELEREGERVERVERGLW